MKPIRQEIIRKHLLTALLDVPKRTSRVEVRHIELAGGQATGLHEHPCPVAGYVLKGSIRFEVVDQPVKLLKTGDAFFEPASTTILHFDNQSTEEVAAFVAFYLMDENENELIHMLE